MVRKREESNCEAVESERTCLGMCDWWKRRANRATERAQLGRQGESEPEHVVEQGTAKQDLLRCL
jgi:hypothetical protein